MRDGAARAAARTDGGRAGARTLRDVRRRLRNEAVRLRRLVGGDRPAPLAWLFVATLPNSGSTALAGMLASAPRVVTLNERAEGQGLVPQFAADARRWDPAARMDFGLVRAVWIERALALGGPGSLVVEKSPPNIARFRALLAAFADMPSSVLRFTRDPYAVCASWAKRYPPQRVVREWHPEYAGRVGDEDGFYAVLGEICGRRMEMLAGLDDVTDVDLAYEALTDDPADSVERLMAALPGLAGIDPGATVAVKDYARQSLRNMNAEQIAMLTPRQIDRVGAGLAPFAAALAKLGYGLR
jgi:hypothetical protein